MRGTLNFTHFQFSTGVFKDLTQEYILGVLIIIIFNNMFNIKNKERGFTLIELLIVIAIIGVLAATVVVSLGDQTENARTESTKLGVSAVRSLATAEVASPTEGKALTGQKLCQNILPKVSADKTGWTWVGAATCGRATLTGDAGKRGQTGEICCHSSGTNWAVWSALPAADGYAGTADGKKDIYCADSKGNLGSYHIDKTQASGKASIANHDTVLSADVIAGNNLGTDASNVKVALCSE